MLSKDERDRDRFSLAKIKVKNADADGDYGAYKAAGLAILYLNDLDAKDQEIATLKAELSDAETFIDLFVNCSERANKLWKAAHPETDYWPDGADNIVWLLEQLHEAKTGLEKLQSPMIASIAEVLRDYDSDEVEAGLKHFTEECRKSAAGPIVADVVRVLESYDPDQQFKELDEFFSGPNEEEKSGG